VTNTFNNIDKVESIIIEWKFLKVPLKKFQIGSSVRSLFGEVYFTSYQVNSGKLHFWKPSGETARIKPITTSKFEHLLRLRCKPLRDCIGLTIISFPIKSPFGIQCHMNGALL